MKNKFFIITVFLIAAVFVLPEFTVGSNCSKNGSKKNITAFKVTISAAHKKMNPKNPGTGISLPKWFLVSCVICESRPLTFMLSRVIGKYDVWSKGTFF